MDEPATRRRLQFEKASCSIFGVQSKDDVCWVERLIIQRSVLLLSESIHYQECN